MESSRSFTASTFNAGNHGGKWSWTIIGQLGTGTCCDLPGMVDTLNRNERSIMSEWAIRFEVAHTYTGSMQPSLSKNEDGKVRTP